MALSIPTRTDTQIRTHAQKYVAAKKKGQDFPHEPYQSKADHPSPVHASSSTTTHFKIVSVKPIVAKPRCSLVHRKAVSPFLQSLFEQRRSVCTPTFAVSWKSIDRKFFSCRSSGVRWPKSGHDLLVPASGFILNIQSRCLIVDAHFPSRRAKSENTFSFRAKMMDSVSEPRSKFHTRSRSVCLFSGVPSKSTMILFAGSSCTPGLPWIFSSFPRDVLHAWTLTLPYNWPRAPVAVQGLAFRGNESW